MLDGMKMATQGMLAMSARQDVITNNLANVGTAGFRKDTLSVSAFNQLLDNEMKMGAVNPQPSGYMQCAGGIDIQGMLVTQTNTTYNQGSLKETGNPFDLALDDNGKGFFTIKGKDGMMRFTRNGSFRLGTDGYLVTQDGSQVMGQKGPIKVEGNNFEINNEGIISVDGKPIDRIMITEFADKSNVRKAGENNFEATGSNFHISKDFQLKQGYLEMANVNAIKEMVDLMTVMRAYEANQKVLQSEDQVIRKVVNEVGRVK